jgi:methyl-accepting chemotaxis protein
VPPYGSIVLALGLGYAILWSLVEPVKEIEAKLNQVATGDFTQRVEVANSRRFNRSNCICSPAAALITQKS